MPTPVENAEAIADILILRDIHQVIGEHFASCGFSYAPPCLWQGANIKPFLCYALGDASAPGALRVILNANPSSVAISCLGQYPSNAQIKLVMRAFPPCFEESFRDVVTDPESKISCYVVEFAHTPHPEPTHVSDLVH